MGDGGTVFDHQSTLAPHGFDFRGSGALLVALAAELPGGGFLGQVAPRILPVLDRRFVAGLAIQGCVVRHGLGAGHPCMTRAACRGHIGRRGIMGVVALHTGLVGIVEVLHDLGKSGRPGGHVEVAGQALVSAGGNVR